MRRTLLRLLITTMSLLAAAGCVQQRSQRPSSSAAALSQPSRPVQIPKEAGICDRIYAEAAQTAAELRAVMDRCGWDTAGFALALRKSNELPPPAGPKPIALQRRIDGTPIVAVKLEADVFFYLANTYPAPLAFSKLEQLIDKMNSGFEIRRVEIVGYADPHEHEELATMSLDARRADFIRKYLVAAGVPSDRIAVTTAAPRHEDTAWGRARDRSAAITVYELGQSDRASR